MSTGRLRDDRASTPSFSSEPCSPPAVLASPCSGHARKDEAGTSLSNRASTNCTHTSNPQHLNVSYVRFLKEVFYGTEHSGRDGPACFDGFHLVGSFAGCPRCDGDRVAISCRRGGERDRSLADCFGRRHPYGARLPRSQRGQRDLEAAGWARVSLLRRIPDRA